MGEKTTFAKQFCKIKECFVLPILCRSIFGPINVSLKHLVTIIEGVKGRGKERKG